MLFVVLNSLQGMLIFVFHVLLSQRCRAKVSRELSSRGIAVSTSSTRVGKAAKLSNASSGKSKDHGSEEETRKLSEDKQHTEASLKTSVGSSEQD